MKRIVYILCLIMMISATAPIIGYYTQSFSSSVVAADAKTKQQQEREKQKLKAQKEREKQKAKAAKQKAKEQAAKQKAKDQAQKERLKATAQKQKERDKQMAQKQKERDAKAKEQAKREAARPAAISETTLYEEQVAQIEKYNARAEAYNNKDIEHRLGVYGQVGYSALFPKGIEYNANTNQGFSAKAKGWIGGGAGLAYQLRYKQFLFTIGAEWQQYGSNTAIYNQSDNQTLARSFAMQPYEQNMVYHYTYSHLRDQWQAGYVQLPLLFGFESKQVPVYFLVGAKAGINLLTSSTIQGTLTTTITDKELIDPLQNMSSHTLGVQEVKQKVATAPSFGLNVAPYVEVGMSLNPWIHSERWRYRVALFAEYGVLNINQPAASAATAYDLPCVLGSANPQDISYISALATSASTAAQVNPFMVGVKFTVLCALPRRPKELMELPKEPKPRLVAQVYNTQDNKPLGGAVVSVLDVATSKLVAKTTNNKGYSVNRFNKGSYSVHADKVGFYPGDTILYSLQRDIQDTLRLGLTPELKPIPFTLCAYIRDRDTNRPLEADVRILTRRDSVTCYRGQAADDGLVVTSLLSGDYRIDMSLAGYMRADTLVHFEKDTLNLYLSKIREGVRVKIDNLFFATNKTMILPESEDALAQLSQFLLDNPTVSILITGHTDNVGSDEANLRLSQGRAKAVKDDLVARGVTAGRIATNGKGESEPVATNDTEEGRALNRRVEFTIVDTAGKDIQQIY